MPIADPLRPRAGILVAVAMAAAQPASAAIGGAGLQARPPQATYSAEGRSIYDFITFDAVRASVERSAVELALKSPTAHCRRRAAR